MEQTFEEIPVTTCWDCEGTGTVPDVPKFLCRTLQPEAAQALHELLQERYPGHDEVECYCCCFDCPGWTQDEPVVTLEEIREIIPVHDSRTGKPYPRRLTGEPPGTSPRAST